MKEHGASAPFPPLQVEVWGERALFTRPEAKVERVTYPVMTPSAAVGVLEAIFWKPEFTWHVRQIDVLAPIKHAAVRRNETTQVVALPAALTGAKVNTAAHRTQRASTFLEDVRYRIHADAVLRGHATEPVAKYRDQFRRRVERGACFQQPYLGTRECTAWFAPATDTETVDVSMDLGIMPHSVAFGPGGSNPRWSWFTARLDHGTLHVPEHGIRGDLG